MGFRVIIVGGSVSGLSLANMLERLDIDYTLLEAYPNIAPQVGATESLTMGFLTRLGYPFVFIERQMLLQVLYDNLKNKERLIPEKRVEKVEFLKEGVCVHTKDGSEFEGDIVVGADGIHSTVREEMWRIGHEQRPGYFPLDEHSRRSYFIISTPGNRTYWFLFAGVGDTKYGKDIPSYSKEDTEKLALEHWEDLVLKDVTFGDIYKNKIMATLVPLEEYVFKKWHYQRTICIGYASHKIDPISGQGGNGALEAVALLTNALTDMLEKHPKAQPTEVVEAALAQVHVNRHDRAETLVANAHTLQRVLTGRSPYSKILDHLVEDIQFKTSLFSALVVWLVEGHRFGNRLSVLLWPSISAAPFTAFGFKAIMPLLGLGIVTQGTNTLTGRHVPVKYAKAILPSAIVGYAIPTILASLPIQDPQLRQAVGLVASAVPVFSAALVNGIASVIQKAKDVTSSKKADKEVKGQDKEDFVDMGLRYGSRGERYVSGLGYNFVW
ncbi:FAD binding domain-containing protein [Colletotrichum salicis]|uniref:FAD binding domain-containing protein n=1 Tax=Colletotrichum salicis TaxID=1209931 RepID=A0A135UUL4_9PEZI|nr:FAD binding domain-containing protein [Colletotrichum salicis]